MLGKKRKQPRVSRQRKRFVKKKIKKLPEIASRAVSIVMTGEQAVLLEEACGKYRSMLPTLKNKKLSAKSELKHADISSVMELIQNTLLTQGMVLMSRTVASRYGVVRLNLTDKQARLLTEIADFVVNNNIIVRQCLNLVQNRLLALIDSLDRKIS